MKNVVRCYVFENFAIVVETTHVSKCTSQLFSLVRIQGHCVYIKLHINILYIERHE